MHPKWVGLADTTNTLPTSSLRWKIQETIGSSFKLTEKIAVNREDIPSSIKFRVHREVHWSSVNVFMFSFVVKNRHQHHCKSQNLDCVLAESLDAP
jgi:hypothetical protein